MRIGRPDFIEELEIFGTVLRDVVSCFLDNSLPCYSPFYVINIAYEEACEKKIREYCVFFSPLHVYKERRKLKTHCLQERDARRRAEYCAQWARKVILGE